MDYEDSFSIAHSQSTSLNLHEESSVAPGRVRADLVSRLITENRAYYMRCRY